MVGLTIQHFELELRWLDGVERTNPVQQSRSTYASSVRVVYSPLSAGS